ncbi:MAG: DUF3450 domain-containing protein [Phycisphaerae bacterium]|nr:DUF3450 domain-containing protein [Phycisphaerae bacterium]
MTRRVWFGTGVVLCAWVGWAMAVETPAGSVEQARSTLERWIETRQVIAKEQQDWALGQEMLTERVQLLEHEIQSLRTKIQEASQSIGEADKKRAELVQENESLKVLGHTLTATISKFESQTKVLTHRLPDPVRDLVKPLSQRLPDDSNDTKLSLGLRFQNVIGILDTVNKFNREIKVVSEVRTLTNGQTAEVTALYIGLGQAYYTGSNGSIAGVGRPSENGWQWEPANEVADQVTDAVSILKNEKVAGFVPLPVQIQ